MQGLRGHPSLPLWDGVRWARGERVGVSPWGVPSLQTWSPAWFEAPTTPRSTSGEWPGGVSGHHFGIPHAGIVTGPHQPWFHPHPSPGCSGCARPRAFGVQLRWDGEQSRCAEGIWMGATLDPPHHVFQCVLPRGLQGHRWGHLGQPKPGLPGCKCRARLAPWGTLMVPSMCGYCLSPPKQTAGDGFGHGVPGPAPSTGGGICSHPSPAPRRPRCCARRPCMPG